MALVLIAVWAQQSATSSDNNSNPVLNLAFNNYIVIMLKIIIHAVS